MILEHIMKHGEKQMINKITSETYEYWKDNLEWIISFAANGNDAAEDIMNFLENEGAFEVINE